MGERERERERQSSGAASRERDEREERRETTTNGDSLLHFGEFMKALADVCASRSVSYSRRQQNTKMGHQQVGRSFLRAFGGMNSGISHRSNIAGQCMKRNLLYYSMIQNLVCPLQAGHAHASLSTKGGRHGYRSSVSADAASNPSVSTTTTAISKELEFYSGAACYPSVEKANGGEDSYFIAYMQDDNTLQSSSESTAVEADESLKARGYCILGVSDGVGGWADMGIDAGAYSRQLMHFANQESLAEDPNDPNPKRVLYKAVKQTTNKGSATVCIVSLSNSDKEGASLRAANLGDSGFIVVREKQVLFKSPYQVSSLPKYSDNPMSAQTFNLEVAPGDTLILATDGMLDNLYPEEVASIVHEAKANGMKPGELAHVISKITMEVAADTKRDTPFSYGARQVGFPHEFGGKMDDVTVVVSYIMRNSKM